jgi:hypothetical protein
MVLLRIGSLLRGNDSYGGRLEARRGSTRGGRRWRSQPSSGSFSTELMGMTVNIRINEFEQRVERILCLRFSTSGRTRHGNNLLDPGAVILSSLLMGHLDGPAKATKCQ